MGSLAIQLADQRYIADVMLPDILFDLTFDMGNFHDDEVTGRDQFCKFAAERLLRLGVSSVNLATIEATIDAFVAAHNAVRCNEQAVKDSCNKDIFRKAQLMKFKAAYYCDASEESREIFHAGMLEGVRFYLDAAEQ